MQNVNVEMNGFYQDILEQPAALRSLLSLYNPATGKALPAIPAPAAPLLTGMGSSYHAALAASICMHSRGIRAQAMETNHLIYYGGPILNRCREVIYLSQSGASGEVIPFIDRLECGRVLLAITNDTTSPLAVRADHVLSLSVQQETLVACKTYLNSLALLWLLIRLWTGETDGNEHAALESVAGGLEALIAQEREINAAWLDFLGDASTIICTGHGPHVATALQAAQTLAEWCKVPAIGLSAGSLRHGFIEVAGPGVGAIIFSGDGPAQAASRRLAQELAGYGARSVLVENGVSQFMPPREPQLPLTASTAKLDEFLALLLDILPVQLFSVALAQQRGLPPRFRYLDKVVNDL
jgi:glucosamine--fructose-6-phosphate aminotransferase (isomerizing)